LIVPNHPEWAVLAAEILAIPAAVLALRKAKKYVEKWERFHKLNLHRRIDAFTLTSFGGMAKSVFSIHFQGQAADKPVDHITRL
jgi:hypothetical protein